MDPSNHCYISFLRRNVYEIVLAASGCRDKISQTGVLKQQKFIHFSQFLRLEPKINFLADLVGDSGYLTCSFCPHRPFLGVCANRGGGGHYLVSLPNRTLIPLDQGSTFLIPKHTFLYQIQTHLDSGLQHMNGAGANIQSITEIML